MDSLHQMLRSIRPDTKSGPDHLDVFREFLAQLDALQRAATTRRPREQSPRRKPVKRSKAG
ncbi:hypothetical protein FNL55_11305 [Tardiphaga sp. vice352]|uniref:hypothetical protein n=1 Tax=unclassified Tardiphaga TaxID=2631404 RepID=UPI001163C3EC|nr:MULTISPECIES: hypothetical protein [unclassified Tardiphaga]QDM16565.1 hypothetical protein FNL53_12000 [Tardiphaga sp. vice278]QDM21589.1 hypothetical protein FIU28_10890 [Tardiphaga sp. vice154]QDM26776.1 hypothetical protein FNL56_12165 [Tardiphaga sp. vice304]QDM31839.1 hypothetical protein FNL55_11305 [Tardiphaga sp. vice352]